MAGNKRGKLLLMFLPEICCMALMAAEILAMNYMGLVKKDMSGMLSDIAFAVLGVAVLGFGLRKEIADDALDYDNGDHLIRFWLCFALGFLASAVCVFLPKAAWPFLPVYVLLGLFGSGNLGILGATVLLGIAVSQSGAGIAVFLMYFISGFFGITLFGRLKSGFRAGLPFMLSLASLLVCETAGTVLVANARPGLESFVLPAANILVSGIMLLGILKMFSEKVLYRYRERYLDLNDPENEILAGLKQNDRRAYMKSIHTAYFCQRIAAKLGLDADALKCAGYYHCMGQQMGALMETHSFPPAAVKILEEYRDGSGPVTHKETAVLMASGRVIGDILALLEDSPQGQAVDYDKAIDAVFAEYQAEETFRECDITMKELQEVHRIFREEKLYYDFLH